MNFYFETDFAWLVGDNYVPAQSCEVIIDGTNVTVKSLYIPNTYLIPTTAVTNINDAASTQYANIADFKTAIATFLTPA